MDNSTYQKELSENGFSIVGGIYSLEEIEAIISCIENKEKSDTDSVSSELFAMRQLLKAVPELEEIVLNDKLIELLSSLFHSRFFLTKAIYFDKPKDSNWFVSYHQDISINVDKKVELEDYKNWTKKKNQIGVQPPLNILENTITVRIHLDDTNFENGALKVIPGSHTKGIIRKESKDWNLENEEICKVKKSGVMLMKPLLLHASNRSKNKNSRRVILLEFNNQKLKEPLEWQEIKHINVN